MKVNVNPFKLKQQPRALAGFWAQGQLGLSIEGHKINKKNKASLK